MRGCLPFLTASFLMAWACASPGPGPDLPGDAVVTDHDGADDPGPDSGQGPFDDHTLPSFDTVAGFLAYAGPEASPAQVKFVIRGFGDPARAVHFEEPGFFAMHDEWSWFRLLNGQPIPGYPVAPARGLSFDTIDEILAWARTQTKLPLNLSWAGDRLYSSRFYDWSFGDDRHFGLGSVLHLPADERRKLPGDLWLFETEFLDDGGAAVVTRFFESLTPVLPPEAAASLRWLVRNEAQEAVAVAMAAAGGPWAGRYATYDDIVIAGEFRVYNPGVTAGRVRIVAPGESADSASATDLVVLAEIPDDLPPVAGIVTAVPQTPLAHIGLLAKSRGTPNAYLAGAATDERLENWAYYRTPVILQASDAGVVFRAMTEDEWRAYVALSTPRSVTVRQVDLAGAPETFDPLAAPMSDMPDRLPLVGGKTAGMIALGTRPALDLPDRPLGLTIKGYAAFLATLDPPLAELLARPELTDPRVRYAVLEGADAYLESTGWSTAAKDWLAKFEASAAGTVLAAALGKGGVRSMVLDAPMDAGYLARVTAALRDRFAFLSPEQGMRFRSSSTAEDVEGFNGAGLYESHTGYLWPERVAEPKAAAKTIEAALKKVWASYWLYGAFEERRLAGLDHLAGNMGVLVHPVFDDALEAANGVATLELVRRPDGDVATLAVNVQKGALSVTNPPAGSSALPEIDEVRRVGDGTPQIDRVRASTEVPPGTVLVDDAELDAMVRELAALAGEWLDLRNAAQQAPRQSSTLTLDLEFRRMAPGWPRRADGAVNPARLVWKQARTLEPPLRAPDAVLSLPIPRDLLARAVRVDARSCQSGALTLSAAEVTTDPGQPWPFDFGRVPFDAYVSFRLEEAVPGFPLPADRTVVQMHTQATATHPGMAEGGPWTLDLVAGDPAAAGFTRLAVDAAGAWTLQAPTGETTGGTGLSCQVQAVLTTPQAYLLDLLAKPAPL